MYIYIYTNLTVNGILGVEIARARLSSADKQTRNYDTECSNHHPSLSTLRSKGLS